MTNVFTENTNLTFFQSQELDYSSWSPVKEQIAQRRSDFFDGEIRETRSLKDRPREGRDGSSEAEPSTERSTYFLPNGSSKQENKQTKKRQAVNQHSQNNASKKQLNLSQEIGGGPSKEQTERDGKYSSLLQCCQHYLTKNREIVLHLIKIFVLLKIQ